MGELNNDIDPTGRKSDKYDNNPFWTDFSEDNLSGGGGGGGIDSVIVDDTIDTPAVSSDGKVLTLPDYKIGVQFEVTNTEDATLPSGITITEAIPTSTATQRFEVTNNTPPATGNTRYWDYAHVGAPKAALQFTSEYNLPLGMALQGAFNRMLEYIGDVTWAELRDYVKCIYVPEFIISGGGSWQYPIVDNRCTSTATSWVKTSNETRKYTATDFTWNDTHTKFIYTPNLSTDITANLGMLRTKCRVHNIRAVFEEGEGERYIYCSLAFHHEALYDGPSSLPNRLTDIYEVTGDSIIDITMHLSQGTNNWTVMAPLIGNVSGEQGSGMTCIGLIKAKSFNEDQEEPFEIWQYSNAEIWATTNSESLDMFFSASATSFDEAIEIGQPLIIYLAR